MEKKVIRMQKNFTKKNVERKEFYLLYFAGKFLMGFTIFIRQ